MLIQEFAERIYTSTSLDDKLLKPDSLEESEEGLRPWTAHGPPSRPKGLELHGKGARERFTFPKLHELEDDRRRGHALHFFANHELLALELMALMLLRFPDADRTFRKTLIHTMRDEQRHLELYLSRMADLGVSFGEIPVNSFFYDHIAHVGSVRDFVVRMSLTFEQANLDFSLFFAKAFQEIGDTTTQAIMEEVLRDEIAHVAHGVRWFNAWRDRGAKMWDSYKNALTYPLTPARAKGMQYFREPRRRAGLSEEFISQLRVYNHSKGRTPDVWAYTPDMEEHLAFPQGDYVPNKSVAAMQRDLRGLPMFLAKRDDVVLVDSQPCPRFLNDLLDLGFTIPEFVEAEFDKTRLPRRHELTGRAVAELRPWGWSPQVRDFLAPLSSSTSRDGTSCRQVGDGTFSKAWFADRYASLTTQLPFAEHCLVDPGPTVVRDMDSAGARAVELIESGFPMVVVKAPWGASGRRNLRLLPDGPNGRQAVWMEKIIKRQGGLILEGLFDKVCDLSCQFEVGSKGEFRLRGITRPMTDSLGRFRGIAVTRPFRDMPPHLRDFVFQATGDAKWMKHTLSELAQRVGGLLAEEGYQGPAGIDAMIVRHNEQLYLRPMVEVNVRYTMGRVALALSDRVAPGRSSVWCLIGERDVQAAGANSFEGLARRLQSVLPTEVQPGDSPRVLQGAIVTNPVTDCRCVLSVLLVGTSVDALSKALGKVGLDKVFPV